MGLEFGTGLIQVNSNKIIAVIVVIMILVSVIAATGVFYVPGFSEVLGTNKARDLGTGLKF